MSGRIKEIDGLRAVAVGVVIAFHFLEKYFPGGSVGVDIFFVISGFVITGSLLSDRVKLGHVSLSRFYWKRVCRIMPALWAVIAAAIIVGTIIGQPQAPQGVAAFLSVMNWARAFNWVPLNGGALAHAWSLSVEEQFYLLWPLGLLFLLKARRRPALAIIAGLVALIMLWRAWLTLSGAPFARVYDGFDTHADGLLLGCLIAFWGRSPPRWLSAAWAVPVVALGLVTLRFDPSAPGNIAVALTLRAGLSLWLVWAAAGPATMLHPLLRSRLFQWGGSRSYSLYLWHYPVSYFFHPLDFWFPGKLALMAALTLAAAELSYRFVEQPFQRLGRARLRAEPADPAVPTEEGAVPAKPAAVKPAA